MRLLLLLTLLLLSAPAWAQAPAWQWTTASAGDTDYSEVQRAVVDADGNVLVLGELVGSAAIFGATTLRKVGKAGKPGDDGEAFVAKLSAAGQWQWAVLFGGLRLHTEGPSQATYGISGVAVDAGGNVVVCGTYRSTFTLGAHTVLPIPRTPEGRAPRNAFVASLDAAGRWRWVLACDPATTSQAEAIGVAVDAAGAAYLLGQAEGTATFGGKGLPDAWPAPKSGYRPKYFVARVTPAGQWARVVPLVSRTLKADTTGDDWLQVNQIAVDRAGNVGVAGFFWGTLVLGSSTLTSTHSISIPSSPIRSIFVAKLSAAGRWQWAAQASHTVPAYSDYHPGHRTRDDDTEVNALAVGPGGRLYLGGRYEKGLALTPRRWAAVRRPPLPNAGAFVAALSPKGRWRWIRAAPEIQYPQLGPDACGALATDPSSGDVLAVGTVNDSTAFDRASPIGAHGDKLFSVRFTAAGRGKASRYAWGDWGDNSVANPVGVGPKGEVYVAGSASGGRMSTSDGEVRHCFIARLNPTLLAGRRAPR